MSNKEYLRNISNKGINISSFKFHHVLFILSICLLSGCKVLSQKKKVKADKTIANNNKHDNYTYDYNSDSTFQIVTSPDVNNTTNQLLSIVVLDIQENDTVFFSNKVYNDVKWINDSVILLRKVKGIERTLTKTPISESQNTKSNTIDSYFNCKSKSFITNIPNKSVKP
jgi:hypothetical protein